MKNFSYWRLPGGMHLDFQRWPNDGITSRSFHLRASLFELSVTAGSWTRDAYYGPRDQRKRGQWKRTLSAMWHDTGRVMSSYCPAQPKVWGGVGLSFPRLNLFLDWQRPAWRQKADAHALQPCEACDAAGLRGIVRET